MKLIACVVFLIIVCASSLFAETDRGIYFLKNADVPEIWFSIITDSDGVLAQIGHPITDLGSNPSHSVVLDKRSTYATFRCGKGWIIINLDNGNVKFENCNPDESSKQFWNSLKTVVDVSSGYSGKLKK